MRGIDPETGQYFYDTRRYVDAPDISDEDRHRVYELIARRVWPRLDKALREKTESTAG